MDLLEDGITGIGCMWTHFGEGSDGGSDLRCERFPVLVWVASKYRCNTPFVGAARVAGDDGQEGDDENSSSASICCVVGVANSLLQSEDTSMASRVTIGGCEGCEETGDGDVPTARKGFAESNAEPRG